MSEKTITELLMNLTDRVVQLQNQFAVVKEIIGDMYEKYGLMMERLHIIDKIEPEETKEKIEKEKKSVLSKLKSKIGASIEGRKLDKEEKERRKNREKKLQREKELGNRWL